jgi:hypothetical protein
VAKPRNYLYFSAFSHFHRSELCFSLFASASTQSGIAAPETGEIMSFR